MKDRIREEELLDRELIDAMRCALGLEDRRSLFIQWRSEVETHVAALAELIAASTDAASCAHQLKGTAASFGAKWLAMLAGQMEKRPARDVLSAIEKTAPVSVEAVEAAMLREGDGPSSEAGRG